MSEPRGTTFISLPRLLELTVYYPDEAVFRWFTVDEHRTVGVTFGEVRAAITERNDSHVG